MAQEIFKRVEEKWLLPRRAYLKLLPELRKHMTDDAYGKYSISNIYYDTKDFRLIQESMEKPVYKEKLRLRVYGTADENTTVFAEIKKKYKGVVYKRRIGLPLREARRWLNYGMMPDFMAQETGQNQEAGRAQEAEQKQEAGQKQVSGQAQEAGREQETRKKQEAGQEASAAKKASFTERQIFREIDYMKNRYGLRPAAFISYDRTALAGTEDPELRVTFDTNIRCRTTELDLAAGNRGMQLLPPDTVLMEVKIPGAMPLWMAELFENITQYQQSYSKYGIYYAHLMKEKTEGGREHAA